MVGCGAETLGEMLTLICSFRMWFFLFIELSVGATLADTAAAVRFPLGRWSRNSTVSRHSALKHKHIHLGYYTQSHITALRKPIG